MSSIDVTELTPEQLVGLIVAAKRALYPVARIVGEALECSQCNAKSIPVLVEDGMTVTHDLVTIAYRDPGAWLGWQFIRGIGGGRDAST